MTGGSDERFRYFVANSWIRSSPPCSQSTAFARHFRMHVHGGSPNAFGDERRQIASTKRDARLVRGDTHSWLEGLWSPRCGVGTVSSVFCRRPRELPDTHDERACNEHGQERNAAEEHSRKVAWGHVTILESRESLARPRLHVGHSSCARRVRARNPAPRAARCEPCTSAADFRASSALREQTHARDEARAPRVHGNASRSGPRRCGSPRRAARQHAESPPAHGDRATHRSRRRSSAPPPPFNPPPRSPHPRRRGSLGLSVHPRRRGIPSPASFTRAGLDPPDSVAPRERPLAACRRFLNCSTNAAIASS